jgi:hypothetical protein
VVVADEMDHTPLQNRTSTQHHYLHPDTHPGTSLRALPLGLVVSLAVSSPRHLQPQRLSVVAEVLVRTTAQ